MERGIIAMSKHVMSSDVLAGNNGITVSHCTTCGFAHTWPYEVDPGYYTTDVFYREHAAADWFENERREYDAGLWNAAFAHRVKLIKEACNGHTPRVIDYGCGSGLFVDYYNKRYLGRGLGSGALGYEVSAIARAASPMPSLIFDNPSKFVYRGSGWNDTQSVVLSLVLEHIPEAIDWFKLEIDPLVGGRGCVLIVVPNEFNPLQSELNALLIGTPQHNWFVQKPHVNYFNRAGLEAFADRVGYQIVSRGATFPMELFSLVGPCYIGNDKLGRRYFKAKMRFEKLLGEHVFDLYALLYGGYGIGRESITVLKRK